MSGVDWHHASEIMRFVLEVVGAAHPGPVRPGRCSEDADEDRINRQYRQHPCQHRPVSTTHVPLARISGPGRCRARFYTLRTLAAPRAHRYSGRALYTNMHNASRDDPHDRPVRTPYHLPARVGD